MSRGGGSRLYLNNTPSRGGVVDPQTYGMLLWQSKLQEKLLEEQKEKRLKEQDEQQRRIHEKQETERGQQQQRATTSPAAVEIPPMIPGPAPYTVTPQSPHSQQPLLNLMYPAGGGGGSKPGGNVLANGGGGGVSDQPMFPNISRQIRTSVSCDNFGKPPTLLLGNLISFQQMGGAGSPRRTPSGRLDTVLRGDPEIRYHQKDTRGFDQTIRYLMDREKVAEYKRELDRQVEEKRKWRSQVGSAAVKEITRRSFMENGGNNGGGKGAQSSSAGSDPDYYPYRRNPESGYSERGMGAGSGKSGIELAPLMRKFNSLPKLNTLCSTDVTRPYVHSPRNEYSQTLQPTEIAESLSSQLREKEWLTRRQQENERLATERHFQTWDSLWGRPGAGAPISFAEKSLGHAVSFGNLHGGQSRTGHNKVNLFKALHMTHQQQHRPKHDE